MDEFQTLTEEDIQELMELGIIDPQMASLDEQIASAQEIRNRKGPEGTYAGRVYVAANPLEHIVNAWQGIRAGKELDKLRADQQRLLAQQVRGRGKYFNRLVDTPQRRASQPFMQEMEVDEGLIPGVNF